MTGRIKKIIMKTLMVFSEIILGTFAVFIVYILLQIFACTSFPVNSYSMTPAIQPGDRIFVNKLIFGPRIYKNLKFLDGEPLETKRLKGFRGIKYNDIVVFNSTISDRWADHTEFDIKGVYVKRCIGLPGDTVSIENSIYKNSSVKDTLGMYCMQQQLERMSRPDSTLLPYVAYPFDSVLCWSIYNFGPLYAPRKGDIIPLGRDNYIIYRRYIEYETGEKLEFTDGVVMMKGMPLSNYTFKDSYYFMVGDNVPDSRDSRYFGLIPEEFIIGVAPRILYSKNKNRNKMVWERTWKKF